MRKESKSYQKAESWLYSFTDYERGANRVASKFNLDSINHLLAHLGNPQHNQKIIHVAGTKGKGSTSAYLAAILSHSGYKTALFQSPHLFSVRERFSVNQQMITARQFVQLINTLKKAVEVMEKNGEEKPSTFDLMTALAFLYFASRKAQIWVIETGLGGRLDSTNIVMPVLCIITKIGLDHQEVLGWSLKEIATEKAGIIKVEIPIVLGLQNYTEAAAVIQHIAKTQHSPIYDCSQESSITNEGLQNGKRLMTFTQDGNTTSYQLGMSALFQLENVQTALVSAQILRKIGFHKINEPSIRQALNDTNIEGRFGIYARDTTSVVIDAAHNVEAIKALLLSISERFSEKNPRVLLFGTSIDKDHTQMLSLLATFFQIIILSQSNNARAVPALTLLKENSDIRKEMDITAQPDISKALNQGFKAADGGLLCICGSFFLVAEALQLTHSQLIKIL